MLTLQLNLRDCWANEHYTENFQVLKTQDSQINVKPLAAVQPRRNKGSEEFKCLILRKVTDKTQDKGGVCSLLTGKVMDILGYWKHSYLHWALLKEHQEVQGGIYVFKSSSNHCLTALVLLGRHCWDQGYSDLLFSPDSCNIKGILLSKLSYRVLISQSSTCWEHKCKTDLPAGTETWQTMSVKARHRRELSFHPRTFLAGLRWWCGLGGGSVSAALLFLFNLCFNFRLLFFNFHRLLLQFCSICFFFYLWRSL